MLLMDYTIIYLRTTIDMNDLNDGIYFVTVTINESQKVIKVIKK